MKRLLIAIAIANSAACNQHPVAKYTPNTLVEFQMPTPIEASGKLDVLWVIDNSGSMCQEQAALRDNFDRFVERLDDAVVDFHIGVTTTHLEDDFSLEPVARPGHLQSTPQPLPGFDRSCWTATDAEGQPIAGDYAPIRQLIATAVACMQAPDERLLNRTDDEIACALGCRTVAQCAPDECDGLQLFPDPSSYRAVSKVLQSSNYRNANGTLKVAELKADFACMSMVGMRGYGFEKGIGAAVEAVSPALTGGTAENPTDVMAPNHGLIRNDATFAVVFVTDENDCTHDGSLSERQGACAADLCEFWNHRGLDATPLVEPSLLRDAMLTNLRATKGEPAFDTDSTLVASIHGIAKRYDGDIVPDESCRVDSPREASSCRAFDACENADYEPLRPSCATRLGVAYSGDRYERFLRSFGEGRYFPAPPVDSEAPLTGWMCNGDFKPALAAIGEFFQTPTQGCITTPIETCAPSGAACGPHADGAPGTCVPRPNSETHFCTSAVEVRILVPPDQRVTLEAAGFCDVSTDEYCVVSPSNYTLEGCGGTVAGVHVEWVDVTVARQVLAGTELELRWRGLSSL